MAKVRGGGGPGKNVVVITMATEHLEADKVAIKRSGFAFAEHFESGANALKHIMENRCEVIVLDHHITDMTPQKFLTTIKSVQALKHIPVIMVTTENQRNSVLDAVAAGCSGYILRPYSQNTFERHLNTAMQLFRFAEIEMRQVEDAKLMLEMGEYDEAIEEFEEVFTMQDEAKKLYDLGCRYLVREKYGKAIVAFQKALRLNDLFAEAYQGLAEAYKGKGDIEQCQTFLKKAANIYAEYDKMEKVKELFVDILKFDHNAVNPFNSLGIKLRKGGDYENAIRAYIQALELTPNDENIYFNLAKAYFFRGEHDKSLDNTAMALRMNSDFPEARKLYKQLKGASWPTPSAPRGQKDSDGFQASVIPKDI